MGTSLRTLAKLTNPAMEHWWKKHGVWLLGAGVGFGLIELARRLSQSYGPLYLPALPVHVWLKDVKLVLEPIAWLCIVLYSILAAATSIEACRKAGEECAAPAQSASMASLFTLALLRTWPAFLRAAGFAICLKLGNVVDWIAHNWGWTSLGLIIRAVSMGLDSAFVVWLLVLWIIAWLTAARQRTWLAVATAVALYALPAIAEYAMSFIRYSWSFHVEYALPGVYEHQVPDWRAAVVGLLLLIAIIWLQRYRIVFMSLIPWIVMTIASVLSRIGSFILPETIAKFPRELSNYAIQLSHVGLVLTRVPFDLVKTAMRPIDPDFQSIWFAFSMHPVKLPLWASWVSPLLNLAWLTLLYLFISRVLLCEPRARTK